MPSQPKTADYESLFPARARHRTELEADSEPWPRSEKLKTFDTEVIQPSSPASQQAPTGTTLVSKSADWIRSKGHFVSFCGLFLFSVVLYLRPYELIPAFSSLTSMAFYVGLFTLITFAISQFAIEGNLTARPREVNLILLFAVAALLSMPMAVSPAEAWQTFSELLVKALLIFIVIVNVVRTERRLYWLIWLALGVSVYLSINAILDYQAGAFGVGNIDNNNLRIVGRINGLFGNANDLALHLVTMAPIAVALAFVKRGIFRKILYLSSALLMVCAIVVTFSRGGFIALVAVSFFLVRKLGRERRGTAMAGFVLAVLIFFAVAPGSYAGRLSTIFNTASDITGSASQRNQILKRSILVTLRYPLFGVGLGNFHFKSFQELGTHNAYTQVGAEMGIPAMVIYIMFLAYPYRRLKEIEKETYEQNRHFYYLSVGLQASLLGYMFASFFAAVAYQWYVYYLVGYAIAARRIYLSQTQNKLSGANKAQTLPANPVLDQP